jgi:hypothetical protein
VTVTKLALSFHDEGVIRSATVFFNTLIDATNARANNRLSTTPSTSASISVLKNTVADRMTPSSWKERASLVTVTKTARWWIWSAARRRPRMRSRADLLNCYLVLPTTFVPIYLRIDQCVEEYRG